MTDYDGELLNDWRQTNPNNLYQCVPKRDFQTRESIPGGPHRSPRVDTDDFRNHWFRGILRDYCRELTAGVALIESFIRILVPPETTERTEQLGPVLGPHPWGAHFVLDSVLRL
ncbi:hypothetical protein TNCV_4393451 [Trichonephila clavipes]|nr:hypothetical protein TNCV_4393451 [Trichonephila clavipes]